MVGVLRGAAATYSAEGGDHRRDQMICSTTLIGGQLECIPVVAFFPRCSSGCIGHAQLRDIRGTAVEQVIS